MHGRCTCKDPKDSGSSSACRRLRTVVALLSCAYIAVYLAVALARMRYPFELQWLEGAILLQVRRVVGGQQMYVSPSLEYVPMIYAPLYFLAGSLVTRMVGPGFFPLRLLSFVSSLGCLYLIYWFVKREGYGWKSSIAASGLFAATYALTSGWFDVARVDSMFLFLALGTLYVLRSARSRWTLALAGALAALMFMSKQSGLFVAASMAAYTALVHRKAAMYFAAACVGPLAAGTILMNAASGGWYGYYVFTLPSQHAIEHTKWVTFWFADLMPRLAVAVIAAGIYLVRGTDLAQDRNRTLFYWCATAGMFAAAWSARLHSGGYINVVMPAYAWISVLFGLWIGWRLERAGPRAGGRLDVGAVAACGLCLIQFLVLVYNPSALVPSREDYQAGRKLIRLVAAADGDVFIPFHPYIGVMANKETFLHRMAMADIVRGGGHGDQSRINQDLIRAIARKRFGMIVLDDFWLRERVSRHYRLVGRVFSDRSVFWPRTGLRKRPQYVYVPKGSIQAPIGRRSSMLCLGILSAGYATAHQLPARLLRPLRRCVPVLRNTCSQIRHTTTVTTTSQVGDDSSPCARPVPSVMRSHEDYVRDALGERNRNRHDPATIVSFESGSACVAGRNADRERIVLIVIHAEGKAIVPQPQPPAAKS